jgi:hypothetical protein
MFSTPPGPPGTSSSANPPVDALAREFELPIDEVRRLYERTRAELASGAHVHHYVPIFAVRKLREQLRRPGGDGLRKPP